MDEKDILFIAHQICNTLMRPDILYLLEASNGLGILPVRVDHQRSLHLSALLRDHSYVVLGVASAVTKISQSDTSQYHILGLLQTQESALLLHRGSHHRLGHFSAETGGYDGLGKGGAL